MNAASTRTRRLKIVAIVLIAVILAPITLAILAAHLQIERNR